MGKPSAALGYGCHCALHTHGWVAMLKDSKTEAIASDRLTQSSLGVATAMASHGLMWTYLNRGGPTCLQPRLAMAIARHDERKGSREHTSHQPKCMTEAIATSSQLHTNMQKGKAALPTHAKLEDALLGTRRWRSRKHTIIDTHANRAWPRAGLRPRPCTERAHTWHAGACQQRTQASDCLRL